MSGITDPIADLLTRIRNGGMAMLPYVDVERSSFKLQILAVLKECGYIKEYIHRDTNKHGRGEIRIFLKFSADRRHIVTALHRVSRPGCRVYIACDEMPKVQGGMGVAIISTSQGVMSGEKARKLGIGGEHIANIW